MRARPGSTINSDISNESKQLCPYLTSSHNNLAIVFPCIALGMDSKQCTQTPCKSDRERGSKGIVDELDREEFESKEFRTEGLLSQQLISSEAVENAEPVDETDRALLDQYPNTIEPCSTVLEVNELCSIESNELCSIESNELCSIESNELRSIESSTSSSQRFTRHSIEHRSNDFSARVEPCSTPEVEHRSTSINPNELCSIELATESTSDVDAIELCSITSAVDPTMTATPSVIILEN
jgi:hypothetical protein